MMEEDYVDPVGWRTDMETGKGQTRREQERERERQESPVPRESWIQANFQLLSATTSEDEPRQQSQQHTTLSLSLSFFDSTTFAPISLRLAGVTFSTRCQWRKSWVL